MTTYSPSPRPTFDGPTRITRTDVTRHVWGDHEAGEVNDWIYASTDKVHCLVFGVGPEGSYRHSEEFRTIFGADEYLHVLEGEMILMSPETGHVVHVPTGQGASFGPDTWQHVYAHGGQPLRVLELFAPPPSAGTSGAHARTRPYLETSDWRYQRDEDLAVGQAAPGPFRVHDGRNAMLRYEPGVLTGVELAAEHLTAGWIEISPGGVSRQHAHGGDLILFALTPGTYVRASKRDGEVVAELGPEDVMYIPAGSTYDIRNVGGETCRLVFGVAPSFLP
jgi:mannose-6-phosphate isomerase-like protein (cupin superfamily)